MEYYITIEGRTVGPMTNTLFLYRQDRSRHIHHPAVTGDMRSRGHHHSYPGHYDADHEPRGI